MRVVLCLAALLCVSGCRSDLTAPACTQARPLRPNPYVLLGPIGSPMEGQPMGHPNSTHAVIRPECR